MNRRLFLAILAGALLGTLYIGQAFGAPHFWGITADNNRVPEPTPIIDALRKYQCCIVFTKDGAHGARLVENTVVIVPLASWAEIDAADKAVRKGKDPVFVTIPGAGGQVK